MKVNTHLPYNPTILLIGISPRESTNYVHKKNYTRMFIADFPAPNWKQFTPPSTEEWRNFDIGHSMELFSAIPKNKLLIHATILMNHIDIKCIHMIPFIRSSRTG